MSHSWELAKRVFTGLGEALSCLGYGLKSAMSRTGLRNGPGAHLSGGMRVTVSSRDLHTKKGRLHARCLVA